MTESTPTEAAKKAPTKKAPATPEFAPKVTEKGRLDHTACGHSRDLKGRAACRANYAKTAEAAK
jgi:hypothetical protein